MAWPALNMPEMHVIHRDIKPSNLLLSEMVEFTSAILVWPGLPKNLRLAPATFWARHFPGGGQFPTLPAYRERTDVYAQRVLTLQPPYFGEGREQ